MKVRAFLSKWRIPHSFVLRLREEASHIGWAPIDFAARVKVVPSLILCRFLLLLDVLLELLHLRSLRSDLLHLLVITLSNCSSILDKHVFRRIQVPRIRVELLLLLQILLLSVVLMHILILHQRWSLSCMLLLEVLSSHVVGRGVHSADMVLLLGLEGIHVIVQVVVLGQLIVDSLVFKALHALPRLIVVDDWLQVVLDLSLVHNGGAWAPVGAHFHLRLEPCQLLIRHLHRGLDRWSNLLLDLRDEV